MTDRPSQTSIVFLHGWTMEGRVFSDVIDRLGEGYDCHAPNLPGHGATKSDFPLTIDGAADFVINYLDQHALDRPILVGWSLGAMVAWNLARRRPDVAIEGIAVIDMSPKIVNGPHWHLGIRNFEARQNEKTLSAINADWKAFSARVNSGMYAAGSTEPHPETLAIIRQKDPSAMAAVWASLANADERDSIHQLPCPMLVMKGAKSRLYSPETGRYVADHARQAELARFEKSGHSPHLEEPELFANILTEWINRLA